MMMCQRPTRAFLIFTVLSQTPYKQRLPSLIFVSIYLTILITSLLHHFFGIFIVCSYFLVYSEGTSIFLLSLFSFSV